MSERYKWRLDGLRQRLPGREVRMDDDLELHVDGTHVPDAWPLDQRWVKTRICDATDAEMLDGLARYVSACLTQDPICVDQGCYMFAPETPERTACEQSCRIRRTP